MHNHGCITYNPIKCKNRWAFGTADGSNTTLRDDLHHKTQQKKNGCIFHSFAPVSSHCSKKEYFSKLIVALKIISILWLMCSVHVKVTGGHTHPFCLSLQCYCFQPHRLRFWKCHDRPWSGKLTGTERSMGVWYLFPFTHYPTQQMFWSISGID